MAKLWAFWDYIFSRENKVQAFISGSIGQVRSRLRGLLNADKYTFTLRGLQLKLFFLCQETGQVECFNDVPWYWQQLFSISAGVFIGNVVFEQFVFCSKEPTRISMKWGGLTKPGCLGYRGLYYPAI